MTTTNHWGIWVDSEAPVTGVLNSFDIAWEWIDDERCLTCEEIAEEAKREAEASGEEVPEDLFDFIECDSSHTKIIGDWREDADGKLEPDPEGEFAAIVGEVYTQVLFSKETKRCALCAPTYPGQADLDTPGEFLAYDLPENLRE
jgi:hypothetical protein